MSEPMKLLPRVVPDSMSLRGDIQPILDYIAENHEVFDHTLHDHAIVLVDDVETLWLEYVPTCYDGTRPTPLVISMHAGGQNRYGQFFDTAWHLLAEQENFIVIYPQAKENGAWGISEHGPIDIASHDMQAILKLIDDVKSRYCIDAGRIYMQGMSMGDLMSMQCGRALGDILAGIGCCSGPTNPELLFREDGTLRENKGPVAVFQSRGVYDTISLNPKYSRPQTNAYNRKFWMEINQCSTSPLLRITSNDGYAYYPGVLGDLCYRNMVHHGHYQAVNDAQLAWDLVFSKVRRNADGKLQRIAPSDFQADRNAIALADGSAFAYVNNQKIALSAPVFVEEAVQMGPPMPKPGEAPNMPKADLEMPADVPQPAPPPPEISGVYPYVSVLDMETLFSASVTVNHNTATIIHNGIAIQVAAGNTGALVDGKLQNMGREAKAVQGTLYLSVSWFAEEILGWTCAQKDGAVYLKAGPCTLTTDLATIIREILA